jgi:hypothetical protein
MSDENILDLADSTTESATPSVDPVASESAPQAAQSASDPGQPVDLDSLARYRYQGRNLKDWESGYMRQQDYTQKTQALAQERRFMENLAVDLDRVKQNPHLAEQFRQIYPQKYHAYLRYVAQETQASQPQAPGQYGQQPGQPSYARLDPAMEQRIHQLEANFREREVAAIQAELDSKFKTLSEKYPFADEEAVVARAQALLAKMKEMDPTRDHRINDKQWDALWKSQNDRSYGLSDAQYKKHVQAQLKQAKKSADVSAGGGTPGHPPRQFRTLKEATAQALADADEGTI